jgi:hypothetical protein
MELLFIFFENLCTFLQGKRKKGALGECNFEL